MPTTRTKTRTTGASITPPAARARTSRRSSGRPDAARRSAHFGRMPVARKRPITRPSRRHAGALEHEDVLHRDHVVLHPGDLGDRGDLAGAVGQARDLDDEVDRRGNLLAHGALRQIQVGHRHHRVEAIERVARAVGVDGRQAAVVAGVHRLQHVERLGAAHLADDDAIGPHAQRVDHQVALLAPRPCPRCSAAASRAGRRGAAAASARRRPRW